jgi:uncharacterized protein YoxC
MNFDAIPMEYIVAAMAAIILYLIFYVFTKDSEYHKNIHSVASVVEELNRDLYYLKKKLGESEKTKQASLTHMSDEEIYQEVERTVYDMVQPLSLGLKKMQENLQAIDSQINARLSSIETGVKQISIPSSVHGNDDEKIISLFKQGISLDTISKELHISKPEVEFVLKINKIK